MALIGLQSAAITAYAWQLDVDLSRSTFGSDRVCAAVHVKKSRANWCSTSRVSFSIIIEVLPSSGLAIVEDGTPIPALGSSNATCHTLAVNYCGVGGCIKRTAQVL